MYCVVTTKITNANILIGPKLPNILPANNSGSMVYVGYNYCDCMTGADANRCTANQDHTVLSLACAGGHLGVVQYLLSKGADPTSLLKVLIYLLES